MAVLSINVMPGRVFVFVELAEYKEHSVGKKLRLSGDKEEMVRDAIGLFGKFAFAVLELVKACREEGA